MADKAMKEMFTKSFDDAVAAITTQVCTALDKDSLAESEKEQLSKELVRCAVV